MMSDKIRTGIAGCGYLGRHHARILTELPLSEPVGFVEAMLAAGAAGSAKSMLMFPVVRLPVAPVTFACAIVKVNALTSLAFAWFVALPVMPIVSVVPLVRVTV